MKTAIIVLAAVAGVILLTGFFIGRLLINAVMDEFFDP